MISSDYPADALLEASDRPYDETTDGANYRNWQRSVRNDFTGFLFDEERANRAKVLTTGSFIQQPAMTQK
jgi:hypothetical protein